MRLAQNGLLVISSVLVLSIRPAHESAVAAVLCHQLGCEFVGGFGAAIWQNRFESIVALSAPGFPIPDLRRVAIGTDDVKLLLVGIVVMVVEVEAQFSALAFEDDLLVIGILRRARDGLVDHAVALGNKSIADNQAAKVQALRVGEIGRQNAQRLVWKLNRADGLIESVCDGFQLLSE